MRRGILYTFTFILYCSHKKINVNVYTQYHNQLIDNNFSYISRLEKQKASTILGDDNPERVYKRKSGDQPSTPKKKIKTKGTNLALNLSGDGRDTARGVTKAYLWLHDSQECGWVSSRRVWNIIVNVIILLLAGIIQMCTTAWETWHRSLACKVLWRFKGSEWGFCNISSHLWGLYLYYFLQQLCMDSWLTRLVLCLHCQQ